MITGYEPIDLSIVKFVQQKNKVHYSDIENRFNISRKTVQKHLDIIEQSGKEVAVKLVRKQNVGIYFEGDVNQLVANIQNSNKTKRVPYTRSKRVLYIVTRLLMSNKSIKIQLFMEELFVSRTTLDNDLKKVKVYFEKNGITFIRSQKGLGIKIAEKQRRKQMSNLLSEFWGRDTFIQQHGSELRRNIRLSGDLYYLFDEALINKVIYSINEFELKSNLMLTDYEFESLIMHLVIALTRIQENQILPQNSITTDKLENQTNQLVKILEGNFHINIPKFEAEYLNIHVLSIIGKLIQQPVKEIDTLEKFISQALRAEISYDNKLITGLALHIRPALRRAEYGLSIGNPYTSEIKKMYPEAFEQAIRLSMAIKKFYQVSLNEDESAYLALHVESYIERKREHQYINAVVVCSTGLGTARFLEQQLKYRFSTVINVTSVMSVAEFMKAKLDDDLIISTIPIQDTKIPVVVVSPFLNGLDIEALRDNVKYIGKSHIDKSAFLELIDDELVIIHPHKMTQNEALYQIAQKLEHLKFAKSGIFESALERERLSTTAFQNVATPHAAPKYVIRPKIVILISAEGIQWQEQEVNVIYFIALNESIKGQLNKIYTYFNEVIHDCDMLQQLIAATSSKEVKMILGGELK